MFLNSFLVTCSLVMSPARHKCGKTFGTPRYAFWYLTVPRVYCPPLKYQCMYWQLYAHNDAVSSQRATLHDRISFSMLWLWAISVLLVFEKFPAFRWLGHCRAH